MEEKELEFRKKELTHAEKMYELGLAANAIVKLRLENRHYTDKISMDILTDKYEELKLDIDNQDWE